MLLVEIKPNFLFFFNPQESNVQKLFLLSYKFSLFQEVKMWITFGKKFQGKVFFFIFRNIKQVVSITHSENGKILFLCLFYCVNCV